MKIFLGILITTLSTFIGYLFSNKFTKRKKYYKSFQTFNDKVKNEISFSKNSILNLLVDEDDFYNNLTLAFKGQKIIKPYYLNNDEFEFFKKYSESIGRSDKTTQMELINKFKENIDKYYNESKENEKKYKTLFIKLGFLIGLIVFILLI